MLELSRWAKYRLGFLPPRFLPTNHSFVPGKSSISFVPTLSMKRQCNFLKSLSATKLTYGPEQPREIKLRSQPSSRSNARCWYLVSYTLLVLRSNSIEHSGSAQSTTSGNHLQRMMRLKLDIIPSFFFSIDNFTIDDAIDFYRPY